MEGLTSYSAHVKSLQLQAAKLVSAGPALTSLLNEEASRLRRQDEASRLEALRSSIMQKLEWARTMEGAARYGDTKAKLTGSLFELGAGIIMKLATDDRRVQGVANHLLKNIGGKDLPFGTVMVCIGPKGVPGDVTAISISELARKSDREESQVISELERRGYLLFSERAFSLLMDRLTGDLQTGRASLPTPAEKLPQMMTLSRFRPATKQVVWVRVPEPQ